MPSHVPPAIEIAGLVKDYRGLRPLRLDGLRVHDGEHVAVGGVDATAAEVLINLINGAILPDSGTVTVFGQDTASIVDETAWLTSLERFGIVTPRAVLLDGATLLQNLALPLTLEIDELSNEVRDASGAAGGRVGIPASQLSAGHRRRARGPADACAPRAVRRPEAPDRVAGASDRRRAAGAGRGVRPRRSPGARRRGG